MTRNEHALHIGQNFKISYRDYDGTVLNATVKSITNDDYEVFIKEKGVIIHCTKDENGVLSCRLNSHGNPHWVDGISEEVAKAIMENE